MVKATTNKVTFCGSSLPASLTSTNWINTLNNTNKVSEGESNITTIQTTLTKIQTILQNQSGSGSGSGSGSEIKLPLPLSGLNYTNSKNKIVTLQTHLSGVDTKLNTIPSNLYTQLAEIDIDIYSNLNEIVRIDLNQVVILPYCYQLAGLLIQI
jgi:hypothetical protein